MLRPKVIWDATQNCLNLVLIEELLRKSTPMNMDALVLKNASKGSLKEKEIGVRYHFLANKERFEPQTVN